MVVMNEALTFMPIMFSPTAPIIHILHCIFEILLNIRFEN